MYERYSAVRDLKGYTDARISKETGISKSTLSEWKNGKSTPKGDKIKKIADVLGVTTDYLYKGEKPEIPEEVNDPNVAKMIDMFLKLDKEHRTLVLDVIRSMLPPDQV